MNPASLTRLSLGATLILGLLGSACQRDPRAEPTVAAGTSSPTAAVMEREAEFTVEGMHCATCPITVRTAARATRGVIDARVSTEAGRAWVRYRPSETAPEAIAAAITESGYRATELRK